MQLEGEDDFLATFGQAIGDSSEPPIQMSRLDLEPGPTDSIPVADVYVAPCDLSKRTSLAAIEALASRLSGPLVLVVEGNAQAAAMRAALRSGAAGLVRDRDVVSSLAGTVQAVRGGQLAAPPELMHAVVKPVLSRRQKQVLGLVVLGLSNGEIAAKMHLSEHTVKCHLYASFRKLGVSSRERAVALILDPEEGLGAGILAISPGG